MYIGQPRHDLLELGGLVCLFGFFKHLSPRVGVMETVDVRVECAEGWSWVWVWNDVENCSGGLQH